MKAKVSLIQINVINPDKAADFYVTKLGFEKDLKQSIPGVPILKSHQDLTIILYQAIEKNTRNYPRDTGPLIVFEVENIMKTKQEWEKNGVEFIISPWADDDTGIAMCPFGQFIAFKDLDGNVHEILQPHPKKPLDD
jgi:catechol 2,3-dioxygenase-like lactoylglutathione lyase family enzyme